MFHAGDDALVNFTAWPQQIAKVYEGLLDSSQPNSQNPKFCDRIANTETSGKIPSHNSDAKLGIPPMTFATAKIIVPCQLS
ncbi:hypothetical protein MES5069_390046 [Mesorhizobium escarrei]|uniref:Uncharacterized protein n=1 Tax=Mesorhizobium escarrei TaxID=666018 RepID=A0ABM9E3A4_9HYPH|nr:hypothetical protein MES5069_390046 [Mesorhizobium escarrei]